MNPAIRAAKMEDIPALEELIEESVMGLQAGEYSEAQRRGALGTVFGVDSKLIGDGTYFVVEADGEIVGCGGWSRRKTLFGSDAIAGKDDQMLDPAVDAARIRAFFVKPSAARRGIGRLILKTCENAAKDGGFKKLELVATLTGVPLYSAHGFKELERFETPLPDNLKLPVVKMAKAAA
jgi:N-acetylglutamate synthase-like GNAT family acetyltransferase